MPKLKTKSGAKKRFKLTATGKVKAGVAGKRHRLISHNSKYIRQNRGTKVMADALRRAGRPYELIELEGEDHWLSLNHTRQRMLAETVRFLETHNPAD